MPPRHPYAGIADHRHWMRAPGVDDPQALDPVTHAKFKVRADEPVATAGSCFAQHVAKRLRQEDFNVLITETAPAILHQHDHQAFNYGIYGTRSGNVYTTRQLRQLFERAYSDEEPAIEGWRKGDMVVDPFRPSVEVYVSQEEMLADRAHHLARVRDMVEGLSTFVFTLGLTEAYATLDGWVLPIAPGVSGGAWDPEKYAFHCFTAAEVEADLLGAICLLRQKNPAAKVILTVSPVPLMATGIDRHVLVSTIHSKSVLRVAAQAVADADPATDYFPSYEIITAPQTRGRYFAEDARSVTQEGVDHVMRVFLHHYADGAAVPVTARSSVPSPVSASSIAQAIDEVACDEELLRAETMADDASADR